MARRKDHTRDELKSMILDAALLILREEGRGSLTVRRIASAIGYVPGTIYNIFPSLDDLHIHISARILDLLHDVVSHPVCADPKRSLVQNLGKMAMLYIRFAETERALWMFLFTEPLSEARFANDLYKDKVDLLFFPLRDLLRMYVPDLSAGECAAHARVLWSSVHGLVFLQATQKMPGSENKRTSRALVDQLLSTYVAGMNAI